VVLDSRNRTVPLQLVGLDGRLPTTLASFVVAWSTEAPPPSTRFPDGQAADPVKTGTAVGFVSALNDTW
jgi:hypothetical protein